MRWVLVLPYTTFEPIAAIDWLYFRDETLPGIPFAPPVSYNRSTELPDSATRWGRLSSIEKTPT